MARWIAAGLCVSIGFGCGGGAPALTSAPVPSTVAPSSELPGRGAARAPAFIPGSCEGAGCPDAAARPSSASPPPASAEASPSPPAESDGPSFPPPAYAPPIVRVAQPGDGVWAPLPEGAAGGSPLMVRSTVHPHPIKGFVYVAVVAIDLRRVDLRLVAGTDEPESRVVPEERRPGLIPEADVADVLAVFNGGYMAKHGNFGMMIAGDTFLAPREDSCVVAQSRDGSVRVGPWPELKSSVADLIAYRQTPICLVEKGATNPALRFEETNRKWGAAVNGDREIRRSAVGLDKSGKILFYGLGEWVTAATLAEGMKAAGADAAAQLDINWSYTYFFLLGRPSPGEPPQIVSTLIPKIKYSPQRYVKKPWARDFFYLKRRR